MADDRATLWYASLVGRSGYASAARRYVEALRAGGQPVRWMPLHNSREGFLPAAPLRPGPGHTLLVHAMPQSWPAIRAASDAGRFIGQTVWEAAEIPDQWRSDLTAADDLWVPTEWNRDAMVAAGFAATHVVPHIVDRTVPTQPPIRLPDGHFVFVTVSTWDWRKRPDLVVQAYLQAFTANDPVVLVLKTDPRVLSWQTHRNRERRTEWQVQQMVRRHRRPAKIVLVTEPWSDAQMAGLVHRAGCYVTLTSAEGWGLGAFDAAAAGVPLIITDAPGQTKWLGSGHPGAVPCTMVPAQHPNPLFRDGMTWALADVEAAVDLMRSALDPDSPLSRSTAPLAARLVAEYGPERIGRRMAELLR